MPLSRRDFVRTLFVASQTAVAAQLIPNRLFADVPAGSALNFAIIGDWGRQGRPDQQQVAYQMAIACKDASANFVISVGDNFYERGVTSLEDDHWEKSFEKVYAAPSLQVPWYVILGNHDYCGNCEAQLEYGKTHPRWIMPARYFSHVHQVDPATTVECFYIDTSPMVVAYHTNPLLSAVNTQQVGPQLEWLERALSTSKAQWKLVFGHHPIYSGGSAHGNQPELIESVLPLLHQHKVAAYFAGHDHDLQHLKAGDLDLFVSGAGSEHRPTGPKPETQWSQACSGFAMASLRANEMQIRIIDNTGKLLHSATVPRQV